MHAPKSKAKRRPAANGEVLAKQKAALERLDELQDAADQLRIFAKRG